MDETNPITFFGSVYRVTGMPAPSRRPLGGKTHHLDPGGSARSARGTCTGVSRANTSTVNVATSPSISAIVPTLPSNGPLVMIAWSPWCSGPGICPFCVGALAGRDTDQALWHHDVSIGEGGMR